MNIETTDRNDRPILLVQTNKDPDVWVGSYTDTVWNGGWFTVHDRRHRELQEGSHSEVLSLLVRGRKVSGER